MMITKIRMKVFGAGWIRGSEKKIDGDVSLGSDVLSGICRKTVTGWHWYPSQTVPRIKNQSIFAMDEFFRMVPVGHFRIFIPISCSSSNRHLPKGSNSQSNIPLIRRTFRVDVGQMQCEVVLWSHHCRQRCGCLEQLLCAMESVQNRPRCGRSMVVIFSFKHWHVWVNESHSSRSRNECRWLQSRSLWHFVPMDFS